MKTQYEEKLEFFKVRLALLESKQDLTRSDFYEMDMIKHDIKELQKLIKAAPSHAQVT